MKANPRRALFDPNARDADGDGVVQDSTRFQRPAKPGGALSPEELGISKPSLPLGLKPSDMLPTLYSQQSNTGDDDAPAKSKASKILDAINTNASKKKFDAGREYDDYEKKFPKHEVDGMMGKDSADLPKMREMMKTLIDEAEQSRVRYSAFSKMSDADLQEFWGILNSMKSPDTRAQFLAMMLADFELGMRKLARVRAKGGAAPYEDKNKVDSIVKNLTKRGLI